MKMEVRCGTCKVLRAPDAFIGKSGGTVKTCINCREKVKKITPGRLIMEKEDGQIRCTNCHCWRAPEDYIGKKGDTVKRCIKCREKDSKQKKLPEKREKANARGREKQYYVAYRAKKREEDEEAYLKHNAEVMKTWVAKNKEKVKEWKKQSVNQRVKCVKDCSTQRGIPWHANMTVEKCKEMVMSPCFYCNLYEPDTIGMNGVDRMDNQDSYHLDNCVPCCRFCNMFKKSLDAHTFVERCIHIASCHGYGEELFPNIWGTKVRVPSYKQYSERALKKGLAFDLTGHEFKILCAEPCHYCCRENSELNKNGIDRKDNTIGYVDGNCLPCCGECNQMKSVFGYEEYIETCIRVAHHRENIELPIMPRCYKVITKRDII